MRRVFDDFEIDDDGPRLLRGGREVQLERRTVELLCYFAEHPSRLIPKEELLERVWNAEVLSDGALTSAVSKLRKALGQKGRAHEPIETVHGRGYRFHAIATPCAIEPLQDAGPSRRVDPYVGRQGVLRVFEGCLERAALGSGGVLLVTGEAGIGKSRTLDELAMRARTRGFTTWCGAAYAGGAAPAYWPWVEVVRAAFADSAVRAQIPADASALSTLVPELLTPARPFEDAHALRFRLFDELTRWFAAAAKLAPRVILLEDVHWSDGDSLELLLHLVRALERTAVLFGVAARTHEVPREDSRAATLRRLRSSAVHVPLQGLPPAEVSELVRGFTTYAPDAGTLKSLHEVTQGNPFFVRQLLHLLERRGQPIQIESFDSAELPVAIRDILQERLAALPAGSQALLRSASVIGRTFEVSVLARLLPLETTAVLQALEPALHANILRAESSTLLRFEFCHVLLQDALYEELELVERGRLHARMVDVLGESVIANARRLAELARHSVLAVPFSLEACIRHCRNAATAAREAAGFEAAVRFLSLALEKIAAVGSADELQCELLYELALNQFCVGDIPGGTRTLVDGTKWARTLGAWTWQARFTSKVASWHLAIGNAVDLATLIEDALTRQPDTELALRSTLLARKAELGQNLDGHARHGLFDEAQRMAELAESPEALFDVASARVSLRDPARLAESRAAVETYRALEQRLPRTCDTVSYRLRRFNVELTEYWCALICGDLLHADLALQQCAATAALTQVRVAAHVVELLRAGRAIGDGRFDDASACIERLRQNDELPGALGSASKMATFLLAEARGGSDLVTMMMRNAAASPRDLIPPHLETHVFAWLAAVFARQGIPIVPRILLGRIPRAELDRMPMRHADLGSMCVLAEAYCKLRDTKRAERLYEQLEPYAAYNAVGVVFDYRGSVAHYLGMLALLLERPQLAAEHLQQALTFNTRLDMPLQLPKTRKLLERASQLV